MITPKLQTSGLAYKCRPFFDSVKTHFLKQYLESSLEQVERLTGRKIKVLAGDRGYRGMKEINGTRIVTPDVPKKSDSRYQKLKKHKLFCKRVGIEPTIGHLKSDYRLGHNFYKGVSGML